ncbi:hypothetical protein TWF281_002992 [Arthrobotrys megalospora]
MKLYPAVGLTLGGVGLAQAGLLDAVLAPSSSAGLLDSIIGTDSGLTNRVWQMLDRGPVSNIMSNAIACNQPDGSSWPMAATVKAGGSITFDWPGWPSGNKGPSMTYLAYCGTGSSDCTNKNPNILDFFKIDEDGLHDDGSWASDSIATGGAYTINIPSDIASGSYLMRHEFINLDGANLLNGAKFYPICANIKVTGGGSARPSDTVRFPGAYGSLDPGIFLSIGNLLGSSSYIFPGPAPISGAVTRPSVTASARATTASIGTAGSSSASATSRQGTSTTSSSAAATSTAALVPAYGQCGGLTYFGATECVPGYICSKSNTFYSQCILDPNSSSMAASTSAPSTSTTPATTTSSTSSTSTSSTALAAAYAQCGGLTYVGPTKCVSGYYCSKSNDFYSQCIPDPNTAVVVTSSTATSRSSSASGTSSSSTVASSTSGSPSVGSTTSSSSSAFSTPTLAAAYAQCGGIGYSGPTTCVTGYWCSKSGDYYSQCIPGTDPNASSSTSKASTSSITSTSSTSSAASTPPAAAYAQCGGIGYSGPNTCVTGYWCSKTNDYYSQCIPGTDPNASASTSKMTGSSSSSSRPSTATGTSLSVPVAVTNILSTPTASSTTSRPSTASSTAASSTSSVNTAVVGAYAQCGGIGYTGGTKCDYGWECIRQDDYYSQCKPAATSVPLSTASVNTATVGAYAQCGGINYNGGTRCEYGWECVRQDDYYSQCKPAATSVPLSTSSLSARASSITTSSASVRTSSSSTSSSGIGVSSLLVNTAIVSGYSQCGGIGYVGGTRCEYGWECVRQDDWYSQCRPAATSVPLVTSTSGSTRVLSSTTSSSSVAVSSLSVNTAIVSGYAQCGGIGYTGGTRCEYGWECVRQDDYYSQCKLAATSVPQSTSRSSTSSASVNTAVVGAYSQCGGIGYSGGTRCEYGWECVRQDDYYSQCKPAATSVPLSTSRSSTSSLSVNTAVVAGYAQCGGIGYTGGTKCDYGWECVRQDDYYSQCKPAATSVPLSTSRSSTSSVSVNTAVVGAYSQCGGIGYTGGTRCEYGWECVRQDDYYSQCKPAATSVPLSTSSSSVRSSSSAAASSSAPRSSSSTSASSLSVSVPSLSVNTAIVGGYSQCGGIGYTGGTQCEYGWECVRQDDWYSQCRPAATSVPRPTSTSTASINTATVGAYAQCGGNGYTGGTRCEYGWECIRQDDWYSQCKPAATSVPLTTSTTSRSTSSTAGLSAAPFKENLVSLPSSASSLTSVRASTSTAVAPSSSVSVNTAAVGAYAQCGGINYSGGTRCEYGWECVRQDDYYSQCKPAAASTPRTSSVSTNTATVAGYAQCGGIGYTGGTRCEYGWECIRQDDYYSQCKPAATSTPRSSSVSTNTATVVGYAQCGGIDYTGGTRCPYGWECVRQDDYYSQCKPAATSTPSSTPVPTTSPSSTSPTPASSSTSTKLSVNLNIVGAYSQCGGIGYLGGTVCEYGWECVRQDDWYSQCRPAATSTPSSTPAATTSTLAARSTSSTSSPAPVPTTSSSSTRSTSSTSPTTSAKVTVNLNVVSGYSQCGGIGYLGGTVCEYGWECVRQDDWYSQCKPAATSGLLSTKSANPATVAGYEQCGGINYNGGTSCPYGWECVRQDDYYSQCKPAATSKPLSTSTPTTSTPVPINTATVGAYAQCGGIGYSGGTRCEYGWECVRQDDYYSQCKPAATSKPLTTSTLISSTTTSINTATVGSYAQCGGIGYSGGTRCEYGWECIRQDDYYSQCRPAATSKPLSTSTPTSSSSSPVNTATVGAYAQCGGNGYTGGTRCEYGWECVRQDDWYSQCKPAATSIPTTSATPTPTTSRVTTSSTTSSTTSTRATTSSSSSSSSSFSSSSSTRATTSSSTSSTPSSSTSTRVTTSSTSSSSSSSMRITTTSTTSTTSARSSTSTQSPGNTVTVAGYAQCGGIGYTGGTNCPYGWECSRNNDWYFQCVPAATSKPLTTSTTSAPPVNTAVVGAWAQCGGIGYTGGIVCAKGYTCYDMSDWYSQCWPTWMV